MIEYNTETYDDVILELKPMLADHHVEVSAFADDLELDPIWELYEDGVAQGLVAIFTARDDGQLIGYNIFHITPHMHYRTTVWATNDVLYIKPDYRHSGLAIDFLDFCEAGLKEVHKVTIVSYHMPAEFHFHSLMDTMDMNLTEQLYTKIIG